MQCPREPFRPTRVAVISTGLDEQVKIELTPEEIEATEMIEEAALSFYSGICETVGLI